MWLSILAFGLSTLADCMGLATNYAYEAASLDILADKIFDAVLRSLTHKKEPARHSLNGAAHASNPNVDEAHMDRVFLVPFGSISSKHDVFPERLETNRIDVFCRSLMAAVSCSRGVRRDTKFVAILAKASWAMQWTRCKGRALFGHKQNMSSASLGLATVVKVDGAEVPPYSKLKCSEGLIAKTLAKLLSRDCSKGPMQYNGFRAFGAESFRDVLLELGVHQPRCRSECTQSHIFVLHESAPVLLRDELANLKSPKQLVFLLGDQSGFEDHHVNLLCEEHDATLVSLGSTPLLTSHCISIIQHLVDEHSAARLSATSNEQSTECMLRTIVVMPKTEPLIVNGRAAATWYHKQTNRKGHGLGSFDQWLFRSFLLTMMQGFAANGVSGGLQKSEACKTLLDKLTSPARSLSIMSMCREKNCAISGNGTQDNAKIRIIFNTSSDEGYNARKLFLEFVRSRGNVKQIGAATHS